MSLNHETFQGSFRGLPRSRRSHSTIPLVFIIVLGCIFIARLVVPKLFPPGDYTSKALHLVDSYATLLGTVGYVVWLSLDMFSLVRERIKGNKQEHQDDDE